MGQFFNAAIVPKVNHFSSPNGGESHQNAQQVTAQTPRRVHLGENPLTLYNDTVL